MLLMIHDVASEQLAAAAEGERRSTLESYCDDAHAHCLAMLAQALKHAAQLLSEHERGSYEVHVALRTVRTVAEAERLHPGRPIEWRPSTEQDAEVEWADEKAGGWRQGGDAKDEHSGILGQIAARPRIDAATLASFHRRKDAVSSFLKDQRSKSSDRSFARTFNSKKAVQVSDEMRDRIQRIYSNTATETTGDHASTPSPVQQVASFSDPAATPSMASPANRRSARESKHARMKRLKHDESNAAKVKMELDMEGGDSLSFKARDYQRELRRNDVGKLRRNIILLGQR